MDPMYCYSCKTVGHPARSLTRRVLLVAAVALAAIGALLIAGNSSTFGCSVDVVATGLGGRLAVGAIALAILASMVGREKRCAKCGGLSLYSLDSPEARSRTK
jgi:hypothetical protein